MRSVSQLGAIALTGLLSFYSSPAHSSDMTFEDTERFYEGSMKDNTKGVVEDNWPENWPENWIVTANTKYANVALDYDENIASKAIDQLIFRRNGTLQSSKIYISGLLKGSYLGEWTDTDGAFPILTRFPDHSGKSAHRFFIDNAALAITATPTDYLTLFAQLEYHEVRFATQDELQLRKAYVTVGDLNRTPLYMTFGRKTINFGDFDMYNPFTQNINNHFFRAESDGVIAEFGYVSNMLQLSATAITGGRHLRTADTANSDNIDNFALNGDVFIPVGSESTLKIGGGYLHGTIYNHTLPHHPGPEIDCPVTPGAQGVPKCRGRNAAWDIRAEFTSPMFDIMAEYTATVDPWPATNQKLEAYTIQGRYKTEMFDRKTHFSVSYSHSEIGPFTTNGTDFFESIDQIIGGMEIFLNPNFSIGVEYSHNTGFAPLVNITNTANKDVEANQLVIGGRLVF